MTLSILDTLTAARTILSDPAKWTQGQIARTPDGRPTDATNPEASCFCLYGAVGRVQHENLAAFDHRLLDRVFITLQRAVRKHKGYDFVVSFNDDPATTHADVLKVLDTAITIASEQEAHQ